MSFVIEILLPVAHTPGKRSNLDLVRDELTGEFGRATMEDDGDIEIDRIVVVEAMTDEIDRNSWSSYRKKLEVRFRQEEIVVRAIKIERLRFRIRRHLN